MGDISLGSGMSSIRGGDFEVGALGVSAIASSDIVVEDITPIALMPFDESDEVVVGVGAVTTTRSTIGTYKDRDDRLIKTAAINIARLESDGRLVEGASTNEALHNRDFDNAAWVKTDITALKDAIGADGVANSASTLTATGANGTAFQTVTKASAKNTFSIDVRRKTGTGTIEITDNNGSSLTDITALINSTTYTRIQITRTQANPVFGVKITTSGDEVEVDYSQLEALAFASSRIATTTVAVGRGTDNLSIDSDNIPAPTLDYSLSAKVKLLGANTAATQGLMNVVGETTRDFKAKLTSGNQRSINGTASGVTGDTATSVTAQQTHVVTFVAAAARTTLYLDGVQTGTGTHAATATGTKTSINIGKQISSYLFGHIRDFRIYPVALTASQVEAL